MHRHKAIYWVGGGITLGVLIVPWVIFFRQQQPVKQRDAIAPIVPEPQSGISTPPQNDAHRHALHALHQLNAGMAPAEKMPLQQLLNHGRQLSQQGDVQALQLLFGKALLRQLQHNITETVPELLSILKDSQENALFRKTILEALTWAEGKISKKDQLSLFLLSMHMMRHESDPDLRATALHAAATMMRALRTQQFLPEEDKKQFLGIALKYVEDRDQPEPLRRAAIIELTTVNPTGLPSRLRDILKTQKNEPANLIRCAAVALADLRETDSLPAMIDLLDQTNNPDLFLSLSYAVAKLNSNAGLTALVRNAERFEGTSQPYIARHSELIENNLAAGEDATFLTAIEAIQFLPERMLRLQLMGLAISTAGSMPRDKISPPAARALLKLVAGLGTPADCDKTLALLGEDARWRDEWNQVQHRRQAKPGIISSYRKVE